MPEQNGEPYSEQSLEGINTYTMTRKVYCLFCNYEIETNLRVPKCGICHAPLFNVVKSHFNNELAR